MTKVINRYLLFIYDTAHQFIAHEDRDVRRLAVGFIALINEHYPEIKEHYSDKPISPIIKPAL